MFVSDIAGQNVNCFHVTQSLDMSDSNSSVDDSDGDPTWMSKSNTDFK